MNDDQDVVTVSGSWEKLESLVGREFRSGWLQVTDEENDTFLRITRVLDNEHQVNEGIFPEGIVEGFHLIGLLDHLVNRVSYVEDPRWTGWNYGLDKVRFVSTVTTRDRIRVVGHIVSLTEKPSGMLVLYSCVVEVEGRGRPGFTAEWRVLWTLNEGHDDDGE